LLSYLKKERPKLLLDETTDEDLVRTSCFLVIYTQTSSLSTLRQIKTLTFMRWSIRHFWELS